MRLLLDTHVLVWFAEGLEDLAEPARAAIEDAATKDGLAVSAISYWELAMLAQRGRLSLATSLPHWRARISRSGIIEAPVSGEIGIEAVQLPGELHADPADRIVIATARVLGWRLATRDARLLEYGKRGHADVLRA